MWLVPRAVGGGLELLLGGAVHHDDAGERVLDVVVVVLRTLKKRIHGNRHGSHADRAEKRGHPAGTVESDDDDPLFPSHSELGEGARRSAGELEQLAIGDVPARRMDRDLVAAARFEVAIEQVGRDVVAVGKLQPTHLFGQCSFVPCRMTG